MGGGKNLSKKQFLDISFDYGLNIDVEPSVASNEELVQADNVEIMERGGFKKRFGVEALNSTSYSAQVNQVMEFPRDDGSVELLAIVGTDLCKIASDGTKTVLQSLNNTRIPYFFLQDKFYFIDQGYEYYVYDGSTVNAVTPNPDADNDLSPIRRCKFAHYHSKSTRIFFSGDSQDKSAVYWTEYNDPTFVKGTSVVYPTRADGQVKGISVLMDALIISYPYSNWIWRGIDPEKDAIWERLPTSHGTMNGDTLTVTTNSLSMVSRGGIFTLSPSIIGVAMESKLGEQYIYNKAKNRVMSAINEITDEDKVRAIYNSDTGRYMVAYCDDGTGINNKVLSFDWDTGAFSIYSGLSINDFCQRENGDILMATENYILKLDESSTEDIQPDGTTTTIDMDVKTSKYQFEEPFKNKKLTRIFVIFKNYGSTHNLDVKLYVDDEIKHTYTITGKDNGENTMTHREKTTHVGKEFQLEIINNQYSPAEIYGIGFEYKPVRTGGSTV